jgi:putative lipoprotein
MSDQRIVHGQVSLPAETEPIEAAEIVIQVEDVSRADAPSVVVAERRLRGVRLQPSKTIPFAVDVPDDRIDARAHYSVRVHVDVSGSGIVQQGDYVSTRSYPVLTRGHGERVNPEVQRV